MEDPITKIRLSNIRTFENAEIECSSSINLFVGQNNSGKTTLWKAINSLQVESFSHPDVRVGASDAWLEIHRGGTVFKTPYARGVNRSFSPHFPPVRPNNLVEPFGAKRHVSHTEEIKAQFATQITDNGSNLSTRLTDLSIPDHEDHDKYNNACTKVLGKAIYVVNSNNGKLPGSRISGQEVPITRMGSGIPQIIDLLCTIVTSKDKVILIDQPETDLHPRALKALMDEIVDSSARNQFFIATHSAIVVRQLACAENSKTFQLIYDHSANVPTTTVHEVGKNIEDRRAVLEDLGYDFFDSDTFNAWLFLEESSAETIIREILIPTFFPKLVGKVRTYASGGKDKLSNAFDEFNRLYVYLNLEAKYKSRAWVLIDAGEEETKVLDRIRNSYVLNNKWDEGCFVQLRQHDFEMYYPEHFQTLVPEILSEKNAKERRAAKRDLLTKVLTWSLQNDKSDVKSAWEKSANEVLDILRCVERSIDRN